MTPVGYYMCPLHRFVLTSCGSFCVQVCTLSVKAYMTVYRGGCACWPVKWELSGEESCRLASQWRSMSQLVGPVAGFWDLCRDGYESLTFFHGPSSTQTLQLCWPLSDLSEAMQKGASWPTTCSAQGAGCSLFPLSPMGHVCAGEVSPDTEVCRLAGEMSQLKWNFLILFSASVLRNFAQMDYWHLSTVLPGSHKNIAHPWKVVKISVSVEVWELESPIVPFCLCYSSRIPFTHLTCFSALKFKNNKTPIKTYFIKPTFKWSLPI